MKNKELSPFTSGPIPDQTDDKPVDRCYPTLPMKAQIKTFGEMEFAEAARANPNGDLAVCYKPEKCDGDGIGQ